MTTLELACNQCGAPLDVPVQTRFATCAHCGSRLSVHRNPTAAWTELAEQLVNEASRIGDGVTLLTLQAEVERLDREWQMQRPSPPTGKRAKAADDNPIAAMCGLVVPLFALYLIFGRGEEGPLLALLAVLALGAVLAWRSGSVARWTGHRLSEPEYRRRREDLVRRIQEKGGTL
jgi:hypothetical protein